MYYISTPPCLLCGGRRTYANENRHGKGAGQCYELRPGDLVYSGLSRIEDEIMSGPDSDGWFILRTPDGNFYRSPMKYLTRPRLR